MIIQLFYTAVALFLTLVILVYLTILADALGIIVNSLIWLAILSYITVIGLGMYWVWWLL